MEVSGRLLRSLPIGPQEEIIDKVADTGFVWRNGTTLHVNCVLLLRLGSKNDLLSIYLACRLGVVTRVKLTTYLFYPVTTFIGTTRRKLELLEEGWFTIFIRIIGKGVRIEVEDKDEDIIRCMKAGGDFERRYEEAYGLRPTREM